MRQRLHLARGLVNDPPVLFLDEPSTGMDPVAAREFRAMVHELSTEDRTIFLTTDDILQGVVATLVGFPTGGLRPGAGRHRPELRRDRRDVAGRPLRVRFDVTVHHRAALAATLVVTGLATAGTAIVMAVVFVLAPTARTFLNTMNYPVYLLPGWLRPVGRALFLSWSADLLRESLSPAPMTDVLARLGIILLLGAVGLISGASPSTSCCGVCVRGTLALQ